VSQITYRANLSAKSFPFISNNWGRTVIVPQSDNTYERRLVSQEDSDGDAGIPQVYYMHNVMPTAQGFQSVGFTTILSAANPTVLDFVSAFLIRDAADNKAYVGVTAQGKFYINPGNGTGWSYRATYLPGALITTSFVSGTQYIYISGYGCVRYDFALAAFVNVTLTGLDVSKILGITGSVGYLLAWSAPITGQALTFTTAINSAVLTGGVTTGLVINQVVSGTGIPVGSKLVSINAGVSITIDQLATAAGTITVVASPLAAGVAWSSTIDPTDFTPSLITGAGGGSVEGARGAITLLVAHTLGFIVYTTNNAVAAIFSNNARYPFTFREILSSGGLASQNLIGYDANSGNHYAYTTSGLQLIATSATQTIFPEVTDFIAGKLFEDFEEATNTFIRVVLTSTMQKALAVVADRYLVISYGISSLTHALVYDLSQKRFGKVRIPHVGVMEYSIANTGITETPKQSIGFLQSDGTLKLLDFGAYAANSSGVIALGKYQYVRQRMLQMNEVNVENVFNTSTFVALLLTSLDGKSVSTTETLQQIGGSAEFMQFGAAAVGLNHSLVFKGNFQLESLVLNFSIHGKV
jgi:hypothetical protein